MSALSFQVHYPLGPAGTHAGGLAGGAGPHHQEPAGVLHRDEGRDSPLKPPSVPDTLTLNLEAPPGPPGLVCLKRMKAGLGPEDSSPQ